MSTDLLFENFETLATAPGGIDKLRKMILQFAIQGKLGTQDERDEPASKLLERIAADNYYKKPVSLPKILKGDYPYVVPSGWVFCRLGEIIKISSGDALPSHKMSKNGIIPVFGGNGIAGYHDSGNINKPTLVIGRVGFYCGSVHLTPSRAWVTDNAFITTFSEQNFDIKFLYWLLKGSNLSKRNEATAQPVISGKKVYPTIIPLPPFAEQQRIVKKIDCLMALCDDLEAKQRLERESCLKLNYASLAGLQNAESPEEFERLWTQVCDAFDLILDCPENVEVLKQTILQLAVQGQLVQQDPEDEPANVLLERIRNEKELLVKEGQIKRERPLEPILNGSVPFVVPVRWTWTKINNIAKIIEYGTSKKALSSPSVFGKNAVPVLRMNNIQNGKIIHNDLKYLSSSIEELPRLYLQNNDILINRTNSYELVGKSGIFKGVNDKFTFASYLIRISFFPQFINPDFMNIALNASYFRTTQIEPNVTQQCGQANFSGSKIKNALIPLPPMEEQRRIVSKVDTLMKLCNELEGQLTNRDAIKERFCEAIVKTPSRIIVE